MLPRKITFIIWGVFIFTLSAVSQTASIENSFYKIEIDTQTGKFSGTDKSNNITMFRDAWFRLDPGKAEWKLPQYKYKCEAVETVNTTFGTGKKLRIWYLPQESYDPDRFVDIVVPDKKPFVILEWGIRNNFSYEIRVREAQPLYNGLLFDGRTIVHPQVLRGGAGAEPTFVENKYDIDALNSAMLTCVDSLSGKRISLVAGGLKYKEFARRFKTYNAKGQNSPLLTLSIWDPQGKRVPPGETWKSDDSYYLNFCTENPFDALEMYGKALAKANDAHPNRYNFPTLCGWMVSTKYLGEGKEINNSPGLVEQMKIAQKRGLNKYTSLAVRLEPDYYCYNNQGNTQQGWWDDEHWARYGSLLPPYETFGKFCNAVHAAGGQVFTYFQSSLPSNDFAVAHPDWMLNDDISLLHIDHPHHRPLVRYDYSNHEFQKYMLKMWRRLAHDGVIGIKFDYPETAWARYGGFDDKSYTTTSAYRKVFQLCRNGMGKNSHIHERNLGGAVHESVPRLDVTAGIVDLQRVWGDASHFEPEMASRMGLRWYKQGKVYRYYPDGKSFYHNGVALSRKDYRTFLTLIALLSGRIELGTSIGSMTDAMFYDLTRVFPTLPNGKAFRPVDFLTGKKHPEVYTYNVNDERTQVILFNSDAKTAHEIKAPVSGNQITTGSLGLSANETYFVFDFWNQKILPPVKGTEQLAATLESGEALVFAVTEKKDYPQIIGTNRNLMCGMFEIENTNWDSANKTCSFTANLIGDEEMKIYIHLPKHLIYNNIKIKAKGVRIRKEIQKEYLVIKLLHKKDNLKEEVRIWF